MKLDNDTLKTLATQDRPTRPGTPAGIRPDAADASKDESAMAEPVAASKGPRGAYEDWRPSEGRFAKVIDDAMKETGNDPRIMARALDQYLGEREQDWLERCGAAKGRKWFASGTVPAGQLVVTMSDARAAIDVAEAREGETAVQLAAALAHIRALESRFTWAIVPREKPATVEAGQKWAVVGRVRHANADGVLFDSGITGAIHGATNTATVLTSMLYLGNGQ